MRNKQISGHRKRSRSWTKIGSKCWAICLSIRTASTNEILHTHTGSKCPTLLKTRAFRVPKAIPANTTIIIWLKINIWVHLDINYK